MNARVLILLLLPAPALAQGFAGLGAGAEGFDLPQPGVALTFPADHGAHPGFRIEWWYLTANLTGPDGTEYGLQWTLFRTGLAPGLDPVWMAHAAVTTPDRHLVAERLAQVPGQAGVTADPFAAWIDEWRMAGPDIDHLSLTAQGADFAYDLTLAAEGPLVLHGDAGYSVKSADGQASYYYSQPYYSISGTILLGEDIIPVTGNAWLDREWSSQPLAADQTGWDWFSLSFDDGAKLMGFLLRSADGPGFGSASWIEPDGTVTAYGDGALTAEPQAMTQVAGREVPTTWRVTLPERGLDVTVAALNPQAWMTTSVPYWEGPVTVTGSHDGRGYLEMTGY